MTIGATGGTVRPGFLLERYRRVGALLMLRDADELDQCCHR